MSGTALSERRSAIASIDTSHPLIYQRDTWRPDFAKLRAEDPVHYCSESRHGPYWSITRHADIYAIETDPQTFSSSFAWGGIQVIDRPERESMIAMDGADHAARRKAVIPVVAPKNIGRLESLIRERVRQVLDGLERGVEFDWVERVSVEVTSMMLATLFDWPVEDRHRLVRWTDIITADPEDPDCPIKSEDERMQALAEFFEIMVQALERRRDEELSFDLVSLLAHSPPMADASYRELTTTLRLLLVGGNDTTRNSMSGGMWGLSQNPGQMELLKACPEIVGNAVAEMIRFQTPVISMRRTATRDVELHGRQIRRGEKVVLWYISGNRDEALFPDADTLHVDRENARQHIAFGMGPHRCLGSRIAELQLRVLWEEILARDLDIEVLGPPSYAFSSFVRTITRLPTRIRA